MTNIDTPGFQPEPSTPQPPALSESQPPPCAPPLPGVPPLPSQLGPPPPPDARELSRRMWGFWATCGWTLLCLVVMLVAQSVAGLVAAVVMSLHVGTDWLIKHPEAILHNGTCVAVAVLASAVAAVALLVLLVVVRKVPVGPYLALRLPKLTPLLVSYAALALVIGATMLIGNFSRSTANEDFLRDLWKTAYPKAMLVVALVLAAPIAEETLFRGFLFRGVAAATGPVVAIALTSVAFAAMHTAQYDLSGVAQVLLLGVFLGCVRWFAGSIVITILLHGTFNLISVIALATTTR